MDFTREQRKQQGTEADHQPVESAGTTGDSAQKRDADRKAADAAIRRLAADGSVDLATAPEGGGPVSASKVTLALFPGELKVGKVTEGHIYVYVDGRVVHSYLVAGGPPPGQGHADKGGHSATATPEGDYVLAPPEHHTTAAWPESVVPWGAKLRERDDHEIEYSADGGANWKLATGDGGAVTAAQIAFEERTRQGDAAAKNHAHAHTPGWKPAEPKPITAADRRAINLRCRSFFRGHDGKLLAEYNRNDFGKWAFDLTRDGARTGFYVHTVPKNEAEVAAGRAVGLTQSHGCVHIRPQDRDEMMRLGYLQAGVRFVVHKYGDKGPGQS